jgi:hypothetical protein
MISPFKLSAILSAASLLSGVTLPSVSQMKYGINIGLPRYYTNAGIEANLLRRGYFISSSLGSDGWPILAPLESLTIPCIRSTTPYGKPRSGKYIVTAPANYSIGVIVNGQELGPSTTPSLTLINAGYSNADRVAVANQGLPMRLEFDYSGPPGDITVNQEGIRWNSAASLSVNIFNRNSLVTGITLSVGQVKVYHIDDEPDILLNRVFTTAFVNYSKPANSDTPIRMLAWTRPMESWVENPSDIQPVNSATPSEYGVGYNSTNNTIFKNSSPGFGCVPEEIAELSNRAGRPLWVCMPPMMTDAALISWFTRFNAALNPSIKLWVEGGNEFWNTGFTINSAYMWNQYTALQNTGNYTGETYSDKYAEMCKNAGHFSLRCWKAAESVMGRSRIVRALNGMAVSFESSVNCYNYQDPGLIQSGAKVGNLADVISIAPYFKATSDKTLQVIYDRYSLGIAPKRNTDISPLFGNILSMKQMLNTKIWLDGLSNANNSKKWILDTLKNGIDRQAIEVNDFITKMKAAGFTSQKVAFYELHNHDNETINYTNSSYLTWPGNPNDPAAMVLSYNAVTGDFTPSSNTYFGVVVDHSSTLVSEYFETGDVVRTLVGGGVISEQTSYKCRVTSNGTLRLYSSLANYNADIPIIGNAITKLPILNITRFDALFEARMDCLWGSGAEDLWSYWHSKFSPLGVDTVCLFSGGASDTLHTTGTQVLPWQIAKGGPLEPSALSAFYQRGGPL